MAFGIIPECVRLLSEQAFSFAGIPSLLWSVLLSADEVGFE